MNVEEENTDILQNIEFAIVRVYHENLMLVDFDVENALSALISTYGAQMKNLEPRVPNLNERARKVYDAVKVMCDWRLGRESMTDVSGNPVEQGPEPVGLEVISACLKRVRRSVQRWNKEGGRQGYLTFIQRFIA